MVPPSGNGSKPPLYLLSEPLIHTDCWMALISIICAICVICVNL
ncbi:MAG: hypothetical protein ABH878_05670 [bacterium]